MYLRHKVVAEYISAMTADQELDITAEICPMTFVRTRLALDRLAPGQTLLVRLRGAEPVENVPRAAIEQGHEVLRRETSADGITRLLLRRG
jgi:tRNA 2-thiouridine synthesizing protein A